MLEKKMGRPPGAKDKRKRKKRKKIKPNPHLNLTPKQFRTPRGRGAPRKDGLPPIPRKDIPKDELPEVIRLTKLIGRIRHLAGRGMAPAHIAVLTGIPLADLVPGGTYYDDVETGRAEAVLAVAENHYNRVLAGKSTHEVMFFLKSIGGWAETADGRKKSRGEIGEAEEVTGIDISFEDDDEDEGHEDV